MNIFFLIGGLLTILLAIAHVIWGEKEIASELKSSSLSVLTRAGFYISYHQVTLVMLINGVVVLLLSVFDTVPGSTLLVLLILVMILGNILAFAIISILQYREVFNQTIPQTILYAILIVLLIVGMFF